MKYIGLFIVVSAILVTVDMLVMSNPSMCIVHTSRRESYYEPYTETYKARKWGFFHQTQYRTNYRIEYKTVWSHEVKCCDGYRERYGNCEAICTKGCVNAICTQPNKCECKDGYRPSEIISESDHVCNPICNPNCTNGLCVAPNKCKCNIGYKLSEDQLHCSPVCQINCEQFNACCTRPDYCTCNFGYRNLNSTSCEPICEQPCVNGKCTAPDVCSCNEGYSKDKLDEFTCNPVCEKACLNGNCTAPNTCICNAGYRMNDNNDCEPICDETCVLGTCIAPNVCTCNEGYGFLGNSTNVCEPVCEKACVNGVCTGPATCSCHEGYKLTGDDTMTHICEPFCEKPCVNGECVAPGVCNCTEDYTWYYCSDGTEVERMCLASCEVPCEPGKICVAPDTCDYIPNKPNLICEPICNDTCVNGKCSEANVCICNEGYIKDAQGRCNPYCSSCSNGTCVGPDVCQCDEGFILSNESNCLPFCNKSCENGECVAPNECQCLAGFEMNENSTCVKPCTRDCKGHGLCVEEEKPCECFYGWTGWDCDQSTVCILLMNWTDAEIDGLTVYNETNSTLMDAQRNASYCYQCKEAVGNNSFCFTIPSDDGPSTVGCFVETESPCYQTMYHSSTDVSRIAGTLAAVTILIILGVSTATFFIIRRHQKRKIQTAIVQGALLQESVANECLIVETENYTTLSTEGLNEASGQ